MNEDRQLLLKKIYQITSIIGIIVTVVFCVYLFRLGVFRSASVLAEIVQGAGIYGALLFVLVQIIQVVIPIIPGGVSIIAGVVIFGPVYGFIYNYTGIVIGSVINFLLARYYGKPFVQTVVSQRVYNKYIGWLDKGTRFEKMFTLAILFPISPDDYLCLLAGLTKMTLKKFSAIILLCKPVAILAYSFVLSFVMNLIGG